MFIGPLNLVTLRKRLTEQSPAKVNASHLRPQSPDSRQKLDNNVNSIKLDPVAEAHAPPSNFRTHFGERTANECGRERESEVCFSSDAVRRVIHYLGRKVSWRGRRFQVVGDVWSDVISSNASERANERGDGWAMPLSRDVTVVRPSGWVLFFSFPLRLNCDRSKYRLFSPADGSSGIGREFRARSSGPCGMEGKECMRNCRRRRRHCCHEKEKETPN